MEIIFPKLEKKVLKFWGKNKIFEKSINQRKRSRNFVFYEGPPTANARPGLHHVLARVFKDIICRFKTMEGFRVERKAGWDTHGLPVELEIEKKLELKSKKDIEKYGIEKFNNCCKKSVWEYKKDWEKLTGRIGFWIDMKNPYITYEPEYIESVWWILKQIWLKKLIYKDYKVSPYCPRCQTVLSSHEVAQGYKRIKEPAIYIKFQILNPEFKDTFLLVWTTTPWTLPANVAVAINENFDYCIVKHQNENLILAKERIKVLEINGEIIKEFKGKDLLGIRYQPLYSFYEEIGKNAYKVISANFVSLEEGTGLVHIAPPFGEEDMEVGKKNNLPILLPVDEWGKFKLEAKKWANLFIKDADPLIIEDLKNRNLLFKEELYEHDYPFCWRCHSPLLYYPKQSWFINMQKVKNDLIKNNQKINWIPHFLKKGRFGEWLKEAKDWALSRERYWGTPLPIWQCESCGYIEFIGSKEDLRKQKFSKNRYLILRHGESEMNKKEIIISTSPEKIPCPLTEEGKKQIEELSEILKKEKIDLIISSDLLRTRQTAEIIAKNLGLKPTFDKRLREIRAGVFEGENINEFQKIWKNYKERYEKKPRGGENYQDVKIRVYNFLKFLEKKYTGKTILLISHQRPLMMLEGAVKGYSIKEFEKKIERKKIKNGELRKIEYKFFPYNKKCELDFHRPYIDEIKFYCRKCGRIIKRVSEVIDVWFDSGSMPFAQYHYPFENKKIFQKQFPADYISEAVDQTRGWFYTLLAISTLLGRGSSYKNVISLGHVLDEKGEKMSKSKRNVVDPWYIIEKYGSDATRWYFFTINQPWDSKPFSENDVERVFKKFILTFWNCFSFLKTYYLNFQQPKKLIFPKNILDKWIVSKLNNLIQNVTKYLQKYDVNKSAHLIENFLINDLSLWYIRRSRRRFQKPENKKELIEAIETLRYVLLTLSKLSAPFIPFLSEYIYQQCSKPSLKLSVHLEDWPKANKKLIDKKLEKKMEKVREIVSQVLAERSKAKIKVRQPLAELQIPNFQLKKEKDLLNLIKEEVNVKKIVFGKILKLDTQITPELKEEGIIREIIRNIQEMRKIVKFKPKDKILVSFWGDEELNKILEKNKDFICREASIKFLEKQKEKKVFALEKEISIDQQKIWLAIKKI